MHPNLPIFANEQKYIIMDINLKGKNALVCGGSRGIGKAAAIELALLGAQVTLVARSTETLSLSLSHLPRQDGQKHDFLVADFSILDELKQKINTVLAHRPYHILINNTGGPAGGPILEASIEAFADAFSKHILCSQLLTQMLVPKMISENYGRIINIISTSVKEPIAGLGVSNTIRGAMGNWAKTMAGELGEHGITVNNLLPGFTDTDRLKSLISSKATAAGVSEEVIAQKMKDGVPMGRFADPSELGAVIAFLASPAASYVNGINVPVDGGRTKSL